MPKPRLGALRRRCPRPLSGTRQHELAGLQPRELYGTHSRWRSCLRYHRRACPSIRRGRAGALGLMRVNCDVFDGARLANRCGLVRIFRTSGMKRDGRRTGLKVKRHEPVMVDAKAPGRRGTGSSITHRRRKADSNRRSPPPVNELVSPAGTRMRPRGQGRSRRRRLCSRDQGFESAFLLR
jgi:hypothetical protein